MKRFTEFGSTAIRLVDSTDSPQPISSEPAVPESVEPFSDDDLTVPHLSVRSLERLASSGAHDPEQTRAFIELALKEAIDLSDEQPTMPYIPVDEVLKQNLTDGAALAPRPAPPGGNEFDSCDITVVSPSLPPPDLKALQELQAGEVTPKAEATEKPARRPLRAVLFLTLGVLAGILTHESTTDDASADGRPAKATPSQVAEKPQDAHAATKAISSKPSLPALPEQYDPKDANTTAAAQALSIGDYPTALRHYHALSRMHPDVEVFDVIVNVLRRRIHDSTKTK